MKVLELSQHSYNVVYEVLRFCYMPTQLGDVTIEEINEILAWNETLKILQLTEAATFKYSEYTCL